MKKTNYLLLLLFSMILFSCNTKQWEEVSYVGDIRQGDLFKIEPLKDNVSVLPGADMSFTDFNFKCISLQPEKDIEYTGATHIPTINSQGVSITSTIKNHEFETWPASMEEQTIKITFVNLPPPVYEGKEQLYFYLVDTAGNCISNIISWDVTFK